MPLSSTQFVRIEVRTDCSECSQSLPLNGPLSRLSCAFCGATLSIPATDLAEVLSYVQEYFYDEPEEGEFAPSAEEEERARTQTVLGTGCDLRYSFALADPICSACGAALPVRELDDDADSELVCSCGCLHHVESELRDLSGALESEVQVVYANDGSDLDGVKGLTTGCPQCGAELDIDRESRRVCQCSYCGVQIFLPEKAWNSLHPPPKLVPWYIRFPESEETVEDR